MSWNIFQDSSRPSRPPGPVGATTDVKGKESGVSLLKQFEQTPDSSKMDDLDIEDTVHFAMGKALENIFDSKGVSRWPVCLSRKCGTRDRHYKHMGVHLKLNLQGIEKTSRFFFWKHEWPFACGALHIGRYKVRRLNVSDNLRMSTTNFIIV